jgi:hypothetical protein
MAKPSTNSLNPSNFLLGRISLLVSVIFLLTLAGCKGEDRNNPQAVVEDYLQAKINRDADTIQKLLCSEMETYLERETHTFETVSDARFDGLNCTWDEAQSVVRCQGKIVATYGAEQTEFPLKAYRVVEEGGQWKWCGESR